VASTLVLNVHLCWSRIVHLARIYLSSLLKHHYIVRHKLVWVIEVIYQSICLISFLIPCVRHVYSVHRARKKLQSGQSGWERDCLQCCPGKEGPGKEEELIVSLWNLSTAPWQTELHPGRKKKRPPASLLAQGRHFCSVLWARHKWLDSKARTARRVVRVHVARIRHGHSDGCL
jgi:hypothetical protein